MLSDEERKAIEYIKNCLDNEYNFKNATRQKDKKAYNIILNLIEKQSKEIEELSSQIDEHVYNGCDYELCNKKWKDKIKAKIEEVKKRLKEETRTDFLIILKILENELQSLLEKE